MADRGARTASPALPMRVLMVASLVLLTLFAVLGWSIAGMYRAYRVLDSEYRPMQRLVDRMPYLDEALTMSAYMAASTGDTAWIVRYRPLAEAYLAVEERVVRLAGEFGERDAGADIRSSGEALFAAEAEAFALIRGGRSGAAQRILFGPEYLRQKRVYADAAARMTRGIQRRIEAEHARFQRRLVIVVATAIATILAFVFLSLLARSVTVRYVAARREADASDAMLASIVESTDDAVISRSLEGEIRSWNRAAERIYGYTAAEVVGRPATELIPPELADEERRVMEQLARGEKVEAYESARIAKDGRRVEVALSMSPIFADGRVVGAASISRDITEAKRATRELAASRAELDALIRSMSDVILVLDAAGRYVSIPGTAAPLLYRPPQELVGRLMHEVLPAEAADLFLGYVRRALESRETVQLEYSLPVGGELVWFAASVSPMTDDQVVWVARDVTERKRAEDDLIAARDAAEAASRAKSDFLSGMSHELRTPLNSVIGFANVLRKNKSETLREQELSYLDRILANGKHLLGLINAILDLSKIEAGKMEVQLVPVDLSSLIRSTVDELQGTVGSKPVTLIAEVPDGLVPLETDADRLKQVLINLVGNAVKFTERGEVRIVVHKDPVTDQPVSLDVADTGIGIPPERLATIFDPFEQGETGTARRFGGTGLGLAISRSLVELLGYRLDLTSTVGVGSVFSIGFRPDRAPGGDAATAPARSPGLPVAVRVASETSDFTGKLVLVIDDDTDSRVLLTQQIEEFGCRVVAASSGTQGVRIARALRPDIITVDLLMPGTDGWETLRLLKSDPELARIPTVVVSMVAHEKRASLFGTVELLQKPLDPPAMLAMLRRHLGTGGRRVLVVDDEADARLLLAACLEAEDVSVTLAESGEQALRLLDTSRPDLIVLDLVMPGMTGIEFLRLLRDRPDYHDMPVVIVTAKDLSREEAGEVDAEVMALIRKDGNMDGEIRRLVHELWGHRQSSG